MMIACLYLFLVRSTNPAGRLPRIAIAAIQQAAAGRRRRSSSSCCSSLAHPRRRRESSCLKTATPRNGPYVQHADFTATRLFSSSSSAGDRRNSSSRNTSATEYYYDKNDDDDDDASSSSSSSTAVLISTKGKTIQRIKKLLNDAKYRQTERQAIVENPKLIRDLYTNTQTRPLIRQILVDADRYQQQLQLLQQERLAQLASSGGTAVGASAAVASEWRFLLVDLPAALAAATTTTADEQDEDNIVATRPIQIIQASYSVLRSCTDTIAHQGMLAVCDWPAFPQRPAVSYQSSFRLILDGVSDPGNLGTLLRSAAATNVDEVILLGPGGCCDPWNPKALRAASATTFLLPHLYTAPSYEDWYERMRRKKVQLYAATMMTIVPEDHDNDNGTSTGTTATTTTAARPSRAHSDIDWTDTRTTSGHKALILGNEGSGLSEFVKQRMMQDDPTTTTIQPIHIPMPNAAVESLNVAVSGSVIMFERARQLAAVAATTATNNQ
jgi:tRNA G18 (ribose-2'-O)-methylase SpoU